MIGIPSRPVFLLDDVASELDDTISARLLPALDERVDQLILTCLPQDLDQLGVGRPAFGVGGGAVEAL